MSHFRPYLLAVPAFLVLAEAVHIASSIATKLYSVDDYQFLEAAWQLVATGLPKVDYWPNSSAGLDLVYWSHHLPPYLYATTAQVFDLDMSGLEYVRYAELLIVLLASGVLIRRLGPRPVFGIFFAFVLFEPVFNFIVISKQYMRWPIIFGFLAVWCLIRIRERRNGTGDRSLSALCGALASLSPLSFVSMGVPIAAGVGVAFLVETILAKISGRTKAARFCAFACGAAVPLVAFGGYVFAQLEPAAARALIWSVGYYGSNVTPDVAIGHEVLKLGYFFSTTVVSPYGLTLLPVGIAATVVNLWNRRRFDEDERFLIRLTAICVGVWIAFAVLVPTHFYAARMIWLLPLFVSQVWLALRGPGDAPTGAAGFLLGVAGVLAAQVFHHVFLAGESPYRLGISAAIGLGLAAAGVLAGRRFGSRSHGVGQRLVKHRFRIAASMALLICLATAERYLLVMVNELPVLLTEGKGALTRPPVDRLGPATRQFLATELAPGDWAVTNYPMRELFPEGVRLQAIYNYRGLFSGARAVPAERMVLFDWRPRTSPGEELIQVNAGNTVYYRGHYYELGSYRSLARGLRVRVGKPISVSIEKPALSMDTVSTDEVSGYLGWRKKNGLAVE